MHHTSKYLFCLFVLFVVAIFNCATPLYKYSIKVEGNSDSLALSISATGFAVTEDHIVTAGHFCAGLLTSPLATTMDSTLKMFYVDQNKNISTIDNVVIVAIDADQDICLLESTNHGLRIPKLKFNSTYPIGQKVATVGAPAGYFPAETFGHIVTDVGNDDSEIEFLTTIPVFHGNSGGPVFDRWGNVIGMIVKVNSHYSHLSFAVKASTIKEFLKEQDIDFGTN